jgi:hypothetical protein
MEQAIESYWNGKAGAWTISQDIDYGFVGGNYRARKICKKPKCEVRFDATVYPSSLTSWWNIHNDNVIMIDPNYERSYVRPFWNTGIWDVTPWVWAHEAGHLMGLDDRYTDKKTSGVTVSGPNAGWEGNIMAQRGGVAEERNVREILERNAIVCPCCDPSPADCPSDPWAGPVLGGK